MTCYQTCKEMIEGYLKCVGNVDDTFLSVKVMAMGGSWRLIK